LELPP
jgi:hypothetical protein